MQCIVVGHSYKCHPSHEAEDSPQKKKWKEVANTDNDSAGVGSERWGKTRIMGLWICIIVVADMEKLQPVQRSENVTKS